MRPFQIFASMDPEATARFCSGLSEGAPGMYVQAVHAAAVALKSRPGFLRKQPAEKQAAAIRRALARVASDALAEELLAAYFLECRKPLLIEWLDTASVEHEEGYLKGDLPGEPDGVDALARGFLAKDEDPDRRLLLQAFAAQGSVDWPALDAVLAADA